MSLMVARGYKSVNAMNPRRGYQEPSALNVQIHGYIVGHYVRSNKVALKYPKFFLNVDQVAHVKEFNSAIKANVKTSKNIYYQCI